MDGAEERACTDFEAIANREGAVLEDANQEDAGPDDAIAASAVAQSANERPFTIRVLFRESVPTLVPPPGVRVACCDALPSAQLETLASDAWYWPEALDILSTHRSHASMALAAEVGSPVERALALSRAAAAVASHPGALAVIWDATGLVHTPEQWVAQCEDASGEDLPLFLWIAFEGTESDAGTRDLKTRGATALGALEVEVAASRRDGEALLETVCDVVLYVLTSPVPLESGDQVHVTLGKVRVRVEPSLRNDGSKAYRLRLP